MFTLLSSEKNVYTLDGAIQELQARPSGQLSPKCYEEEEWSGLSAWNEQNRLGSSVGRVPDK